MEMRTIWSYTEPTCFSNSARCSASNDFEAASMYSSGMPSTVSSVARPRICSDFAFPDSLPSSMVSATSGRLSSARTFGEVVAVQTTMRLPFL